MTINAKEIYPSAEMGEYFDEQYDYQPIINAIGTPLLQIEDDDYKGDTRVLCKNDDKYGILIIGWGSCSGCDALQACSTYDELQELIDVLEKDVKWFDTAEIALEYFNTTDWGLKHCWHQDETKQFINEAIKILEEVI